MSGLGSGKAIVQTWNQAVEDLQNADTSETQLEVRNARWS